MSALGTKNNTRLPLPACCSAIFKLVKVLPVPQAMISLPRSASYEAVADSAEDTGDVDSARHWNHQAALHGHVDAMRDLIDEDDRDNLFQSWVWVYLAEHLGTDLRKSTLRAYHDGGLYAGQEYDDDQGGPLYVDGDEGVHLEPLSASDDVRARAAARELLNRIKHA